MSAIDKAMATLKTESQRIAFRAALDEIANGGREIDAYAAAQRNRDGPDSTHSGPVSNLQDQIVRAAKTARGMGAEAFARHLDALVMLAEFLRSSDDVVLFPPNVGPVETVKSDETAALDLLSNPRVVLVNQRPLKALCKTKSRKSAGTIGPAVSLIRRHAPDLHWSVVHEILLECGQTDIKRNAVDALWNKLKS